jgi:cytoskeleton protein RodZ
MSEATLDPGSDAKRAPPLPGPQLAAARAGCGLSVADVARQLKLAPWQVEALETDNYARMPGMVFVRGFIRNYARLVKLDPAGLLMPAPSQLAPATQAMPQSSPSVEIPFRSGPAVAWRKYAIAATLLLVPFAIFEMTRDDATEIAVKSRLITLPQTEMATEESVAQTRERSPALATGDTVDGPMRSESGLSRREKTSAVPALPAVSAPVAEHKPGEHLVKLKFEREAWVEIRDRSGRRIFSRLNPAGTEQAVSGQPPLSLIVGNAAGVRVIHNDQSVDLAPYIQIDVARLTLE